MKQFILSISILLLLSLKVLGFEFPKVYQQPNAMFKQDSNTLNFNLYNNNFLWNNEFFNDIYDGYTLIGFHITPTLQYHFTKNFTIEGGVHLLKYSGLDKFSSVLPVYRATYHKNHFALTLGTLYGTVNHRLADPMYFAERSFTNALENGMQYVLNKPRIHVDLWLDWRHFIVQNDSTQEKLTAGLATETYAIKNDNWELTIPISLLIIHQGGQIDTSSANMKTAMNYSVGIRAGRKINTKLLHKVEGEMLRICFRDNSPTVESIYDTGYGYLTSTRLSHNQSFLQVGYWYGYHFLSVMGNPMYQCESYNNASFNRTERQLIHAKLFLNKEIIKGINMGFMGETYYDLESKNFDFTTGFTLLVDQSFFLKRFNFRK